MSDGLRKFSTGVGGEGAGFGSVRGGSITDGWTATTVNGARRAASSVGGGSARGALQVQWRSQFFAVQMVD